MLFHIFCRNSGRIIKSQWVAKPTTTFSWELPMPSNAEQLICSLIIAMLLPWWADSPSLRPALVLVLLVFYLKWSCTRSKAPSHHLSCLHLFLAFARLVSVCQCFSVHWRCPDGIWCSKCKFKNAKNRNIYLGVFFCLQSCYYKPDYIWPLFAHHQQLGITRNETSLEYPLLFHHSDRLVSATSLMRQGGTLISCGPKM